MKTLCLAILACIVLGCSHGVQFAPLHLTSDIPDAFTKRNVFPDESGILKYKLTELVGRIVSKEAGAEGYDITKVILKSDYKPGLVVVNDADGQIFEGLVDRSAAAKVSYIAIATSLSVNDIAAVSIRDRNVVFVDNRDIPWELLIEEAKSLKDSTTRVFWIQGALLASLDFSRMVEIKSDASGVLGSTFGVEGKVYNKQSEGKHEYRISVFLMDLNKLAAKASGHSLLPITEIVKDPAVQKSFQATGIEIGRIRTTTVP